MIGVSLVGCGSMSAGGSEVSQSAAASGEVRGLVLRPPGLDPRSGGAHGVSGQGGGLCSGPGVVPVAGDPIEARDQQGRMVATVATDSTGSFRFTLPPGPYRVVESVFGIGENVEVHSGSTTTVTLTIASDCSTPGR